LWLFLEMWNLLKYICPSQADSEYMSVIPNKQRKKCAIHTARVQKTAKLCGVSTSLVYKVLSTDRDNELVVTIFMALKEKEAEAENILLKEVRRLLPFDMQHKSAMQQAMTREAKAGNHN